MFYLYEIESLKRLQVIFGFKQCVCLRCTAQVAVACAGCGAGQCLANGRAAAAMSGVTRTCSLLHTPLLARGLVIPWTYVLYSTWPPSTLSNLFFLAAVLAISRHLSGSCFCNKRLDSRSLRALYWSYRMNGCCTDPMDDWGPTHQYREAPIMRCICSLTSRKVGLVSDMQQTVCGFVFVTFCPLLR